MKKLSIALNICLIILLAISFFFNFHKKNDEKYLVFVSEDSDGEGIYLTLFDKAKNENILFLGYDNDNKIYDLTLLEHNGFTFTLKRVNNKNIHYAIFDKDSDYYNITNFNVTYVGEEQETLINRNEQYNIFSKLYRLLDDGKTELSDLDINKEN
jgi:hypothetical protein